MNTKDVGDISEAMVLAELVKRGKHVLLPFGDNRRYDFVVDMEDGTFCRVQVKTGRVVNGCVRISTSNYSTKHQTHQSYRGSADIIAAYCKQTGKVYWLPVDEVGPREVLLRLEPTINNQENRVRWASDYEFK